MTNKKSTATDKPKVTKRVTKGRPKATKKIARGKPEHKPTKAKRDTVAMHAMVGTPQEDIARVLGIDPKTLRKHYRDDLDLATASANADIGGALYRQAIDGNVSAQIFWLKTRAGFREKSEVDLTSSDGSMTPTGFDINFIEAKAPDVEDDDDNGKHDY